MKKEKKNAAQKENHGKIRKMKYCTGIRNFANQCDFSHKNSMIIIFLLNNNIYIH